MDDPCPTLNAPGRFRSAVGSLSVLATRTRQASRSLDRARHLRHRVAMEGDPLADVLTLASARCVRIGTLKAGGTWALRFPPPQKMELTAVVKGACWLAVDGERAPLRLETGDVFMVPAERSYVLASDLKASQLDGLALFTKARDNVATVGDGRDFFAIGGHVSLDPDRGGVLADVLPPVIHVDASSSEASTIRWLLDQLVKEVSTNRPGVELASKQLAQLLFVQIIRFHLASSNTMTTGWLRALNDERIAPALRLMHGEPSRAWRLSELAKHVGMSRTSFALRFKANAGVAPRLPPELADAPCGAGASRRHDVRRRVGGVPWLRIRQRVQQRVQAANRHGTQAVSIRSGTDGSARLIPSRSESTPPILSESITPPASIRHRQTIRRH